MRIGIIGANGFLGSWLMRALADAGNDLVPVLRDSGDPGALDVAIDCNGDARRFWAEQNPGLSFRANVASVSDRLSTLDYGLYVFVSTVDVYGTATGDRAGNHEDALLRPEDMATYGFHKYLAELAVRHHAKRFLILRLGTLIGPRLKKNPVFDALTGNSLRQTPESTLSLIDLDHVARAVDRLMTERKTGVFNLSASASITIARMADMVSEAGGPAAVYAPRGTLLHTGYDIAVDRIAPLVAPPASETMLREFLAGAI